MIYRLTRGNLPAKYSEIEIKYAAAWGMQTFFNVADFAGVRKITVQRAQKEIDTLIKGGFIEQVIRR